MIEAVQGAGVGSRSRVGSYAGERAARPIPRPGRSVPILRAGAEQHYHRRDAERAALKGPAVLLHSMIDQMGGAASSASKGDYVSLSV